MRRRALLVGGAAAAAIALWPRWVRRALADASLRPSELAGDLVAVAEAGERARRAGKPLLVLVVPEEERAHWPRGMAFGELLNHGSDEQLAPLALAERAPERRPALLHLLAEAARARLVAHPPSGSHWADSAACGPTRIEELPQKSDSDVYGCGMGFLPERSRRFLYFYARSPEARARR